MVINVANGEGQRSEYTWIPLDKVPISYIINRYKLFLKNKYSTIWSIKF